MTRPIVQSLWIGPRLSTMEQVSIQSFLHHGHDFHLYCYEPVAGVPEGTTLIDAAEILPPSEIFFYKQGFGKGSPAAFANMFRYMLLIKMGNWWVDTDVVCLKPFDFAGEHIVGQQLEADGSAGANNAIMKAPVDSDLAWHCYRFCLSVDRDNMQWGHTGPKLVEDAVHHLGMKECIEPPSTFYPIDYWQIEQFFEDRPAPRNSHAVHLWHAVWNWRSIDPDEVFPPDCMWEQLRRLYLPGYQTPQLSQIELARIRDRLAKAHAPPRPHFLKRLSHRIRSFASLARRAG